MMGFVRVSERSFLEAVQMRESMSSSSVSTFLRSMISSPESSSPLVLCFVEDSGLILFSPDLDLLVSLKGDELDCSLLCPLVREFEEAFEVRELSH